MNSSVRSGLQAYYPFGEYRTKLAGRGRRDVGRGRACPTLSGGRTKLARVRQAVPLAGCGKTVGTRCGRAGLQPRRADALNLS